MNQHVAAYRCYRFIGHPHTYINTNRYAYRFDCERCPLFCFYPIFSTWHTFIYFVNIATSKARIKKENKQIVRRLRQSFNMLKCRRRVSTVYSLLCMNFSIKMTRFHVIPKCASKLNEYFWIMIFIWGDCRECLPLLLSVLIDKAYLSN